MISYSVIVPAYNAGLTIERCLKALLGQDIPQSEFEVIVVDDGSADDTSGIAGRFPVTVIKQKNSGPATARNRGAAVAKGKIILFTDSDCVPDRNWISEMARPFNDPKVIAVKGAYRTEQTSVMARFSQIEFEERFEMLKKADTIDMIDTYSAGFRADVFKRMGGFDTSFPVANNEDTELSYRMSALGYRMVFNPKAIVCHLNHPATVKRYARIKFWRGYWRMVVYKRFPDKMIKDTYTPQTLKFQTLALFLFLIGVPLSLMFPFTGSFFLVLIAISFLALSMPFSALALKRSPLLGMLSPLFLMLRAGAIGSGALWGTIKINLLK